MNAHQQAAFEAKYGREPAMLPGTSLQPSHEHSRWHALHDGYAAALASQSETLRALVEALKEARSCLFSDGYPATCEEIKRFDAALSLAAKLGVE